MRDEPTGKADRDDLVLACYASEDYRTAIAAFVSKTKPEFKGH